MAPWSTATPNTAAHLDDSILTSQVKRALLSSPVTGSADLGVESHEGVVSLSGMAIDQTQMDLAVFVALNVAGVSQVHSLMFTHGTAPANGTRKSYTPDQQVLRAARLLDQQQGRLPPLLPLPPSVSPYPQQGEQPAAVGTPSSPSRFTQAAHSVLGIHSIQEELLIKH